ncbi:MBL fold metallo-hydrolase [Candidatus Bathyarchaeota archaeon]|nr:MBL fold metallo-hydrolase [Candidatus Bathyarchaeota archaeon]MBS7630304.1 MBL fold metallo-hydrolase [Candidatus Bathyarchaeota archaeon]
MKITEIEAGVYLIDAPYHGRLGILGTYVVIGAPNFVVDPGPTESIPGVIEGLKQLGIEKNSELLVGSTHIHLDHTGGVWKILETFQNAKVHVHPRGAKHLADPSILEASARQFFGSRVDDYGEIRGAPADRIIESKDDEKLSTGCCQVEIIWTPGHSSHHQCYFLAKEGVLIAGDAAGFYSPLSGTVMPTTPPPFNPEKAVESLDRLISLSPKIVCYSHFGFSHRGIEKLKLYKKQVILWSRIVEEGLEKEENIEDIYAKIKLEDPMTKRWIEPSDRREAASLFNLQGFIEYFKWKKTKNLS